MKPNPKSEPKFMFVPAKRERAWEMACEVLDNEARRDGADGSDPSDPGPDSLFENYE